MLYNAKNGTIRIGGTTMDYIRFGRGARTVIMLPGLGDGLRSMKGAALPMALMYRVFCRHVLKKNKEKSGWEIQPD